MKMSREKMMQRFASRPARPGDVDAIVRLQYDAVDRAWRPLIGNFDAFLAERFNPAAQTVKYHERLADPDRILQVVEAAGEIAGFGGARKCTPEDQPPGFGWQGSAFYLAPAFEGSGASEVLFKGIFDALRARGAGSVAGWCLADNRVARNFYERRGAKLVTGIETPQDYAAVAPHVAYGWKL